MEEKSIKVNSFKGQSYGAKDGKIILTFHYEGRVAGFAKFSPQHGPYHMDNEDYTYLQDKYPAYLPVIGDPYYKKSKTDWGYDAEEGLCRLMVEGKVNLVREETDTGTPCLVKFAWCGEAWDAEVTRNKKRKLPRRQDFVRG